jgi:hypothetical protein
MFELIRLFHGVTQYMDATNKLLNQLMELISQGVGNIVAANVLQFLTSVLQLPDTEAAKLAEQRKTSRGDEDLKLVERDVKVFISALVKHCSKVHLIYKRLLHNNINGVPYLVCFLSFLY